MPSVCSLINSVFFLKLMVKNLQFEDGKMIPASKFFSSGESSSVELTDEEKKMAAEIKARNDSWPIHFNCHTVTNFQR